MKNQKLSRNSFLLQTSTTVSIAKVRRLESRSSLNLTVYYDLLVCNLLPPLPTMSIAGILLRSHLSSLFVLISRSKQHREKFCRQGKKNGGNNLRYSLADNVFALHSLTS